MKKVVLSFTHKLFIYKFKLTLSVESQGNMFNLDPEHIQKLFIQELEQLLLNDEEKMLIESLSLGLRKEFVVQIRKEKEQRKTVDYVGNSVSEWLHYFTKKGESELEEEEQSGRYCRELWLFLQRIEEKEFFHQISNRGIFNILFMKSEKFYQKQENSKQEIYTHIDNVLSSVEKIVFSLEELPSTEEIINILLLSMDSLMKIFSINVLTRNFSQIGRIIKLLINKSSNLEWIYTPINKNKENGKENITCLLRLIINFIDKENKNMRILSEVCEIVLILLKTANKMSLNELLLLITELVNLGIITKIEFLVEGLNMLRFRKNFCAELSIGEELGYYNLPKFIKLKEISISSHNWDKEYKIFSERIKILKEEFDKYKNGQIIRYKEKNVEIERERIRKESFIETTFEEIKTKFEETLASEHMIEIKKFYENKIKEKEEIIGNLEETIAQFVDVKAKYRKNKMLGIWNECVNVEIKGTAGCFMKGNVNIIPSFKQETLNPLKILEENVNNNETELISHILPPPPPLHLNSLSLPPPPPPPLTIGTPSLPPPPPLSLPPLILAPPPLSHSRMRKSLEKKKKGKIINWIPVDLSTLKNSFWENVQIPQIDSNELEKFIHSEKENSKNNHGDSSQKRFMNQQKKSMLKAERAKNVEIVLKKTRLKIYQICEAILELDEDVLTENNIDALLNGIPTSEEFEIYANLNIEDPQEWTDADVFYCEITKINGYAELLQALRFKNEFEFISENFNNKIEEFDRFFEELKNDSFFQSFLTHLLAIGNYMNEDTARGNAFGFKLESISKTYIMMGQDKETSLFEYVLKLMNKKEIEFPNKNNLFPQKLTSIEVLKEDLKELTAQCRNVQECLLRSDEEDTKTPQVFLAFFISCREKITVFDHKYLESFKHYQRVSDFYCEKLESEKLIHIVNEFRFKVLKFMEKNRIKGKNE